MLTNTWKEINSKETYYFKENGKAAKDEWMDRYHFENDGLLSKNKWIGLIYADDTGNIINIKNLPLISIVTLIFILLLKKISWKRKI